MFFKKANHEIYCEHRGMEKGCDQQFTTRKLRVNQNKKRNPTIYIIIANFHVSPFYSSSVYNGRSVIIIQNFIKRRNNLQK